MELSKEQLCYITEILKELFYMASYVLHNVDSVNYYDELNKCESLIYQLEQSLDSEH